MLGLLGFAHNGVAASSVASSWQSMLGNVAANSAFAVLQSSGATGGVGVHWSVLAGVGIYYLVARHTANPRA